MNLVENMFNLRSAKINVRMSACFIVLLPLVLVSCGRQETEDFGSKLQDWKADAKVSRFTTAESNSLLTNETEIISGKKYPKSKATLKFLYDKTNAPAAFKTEFGELTAGAVMKGYLNLGVAPAAQMQSRFVANFEKVSTWKNMKGSDGKVVFSDAFSTDAQSKKIPDWSDGLAAANGEIHFATLALDTGTGFGAIAVPVKIGIYNRSGAIQAEVSNVKDVVVPFFGPIIKAGKLKIYLKTFPQEKGWYVYGAAAVKMEKLEEALKPEVMSRYVDSFFGWLKLNTILALN